MVSRHIGSMQGYLEAKAKIRDVVVKKSNTEDVIVNAADSGSNIFLTVSGTSIEMGDDGATGRGNRGNGLITPMRPMTMEAIAGKNPVSHVGKIYNVLAQRMAQEISQMDGVVETYVTLVSKIGSPLDEPLYRGVRICGDGGFTTLSDARVESIMDYWLERTDDLVEEFVHGKLTVY
jgi:S-adenosylmethionine synthetase